MLIVLETINKVMKKRLPRYNMPSMSNRWNNNNLQ